MSRAGKAGKGPFPLSPSRPFLQGTPRATAKGPARVNPLPTLGIHSHPTGAPMSSEAVMLLAILAGAYLLGCLI